MLGDAVHAPGLAGQLLASRVAGAGPEASIRSGGSDRDDVNPSATAPKKNRINSTLAMAQWCADKVKKC
jgi:hypothetical protein